MMSLLTSAATGQKILNCHAISLHDELVCCTDAVSWTVGPDLKYQRVIQTTRSLQHRAAARATPQHGDAARLARRHIHFRGHIVRVADHHEMIARLPETEDFFRGAFLAPVE